MTHLKPRYVPDYYDDGTGNIHLEGEFEFPADWDGITVHSELRDRAELIGGVVTMEGGSRTRVYPWNGPGSFRLQFGGAKEPLESITVLDDDGEPVEEYPIEELKEMGREAEKVTAALNETMTPTNESDDNDEPEHGKTYRIDFGSGELVPVDDEGDDE